MKKIKEFWNNNKNKPLFKGKVLAVIMLILAIIVNFSFTDNTQENGEPSQSSANVVQQNDEKKQNAKEETKTESNKKIQIGKSNVIALGIGVAALAAVKIKREHDLNGRHNENEKEK